MKKSCIICRIEASPELQLQYCDQCLSALYCSRTCQRIDWKKRHKKVCKLLNVGHGGMQVRTDEHTTRKIELKRDFEERGRSLDEDTKRFFKLFQDSTFGSRVAAQKMKKIAKRQSKNNQKFLLYHSLQFLSRSSDSEMLSWPNSPLLVMLQLVDPNVLFGEGGGVEDAPLHFLANLADPSDYSTHENQLILAKQLIEHGANVNTVSTPYGYTPLHTACHSDVVTNLDFVELLLEADADPNARDHTGDTPLIYTVPDAPGAAEFLLNWSTTDANITNRSGASFLNMVRSAITDISDKVALPDNPDQVANQFQLQQWRGIEEMLVERGAHDTWITAVNEGYGLAVKAWLSDMKNGVIFGGLAIIFGGLTIICLFERM
jgi:hypothetical protein